MKNTAVIVARKGAGSPSQLLRAFGEGLVTHGWRVRVSRTHEDCDLLVTWSAKARERIDAQLERSRHVCVLERGYVGDRRLWTSVSFGGNLNNRARFVGPFEDGTRWQRHFANYLEPKRRLARSHLALLVGQVPTDYAVSHVDFASWLTITADALTRTGYGVVYRPHPLALDYAPGDLAQRIAPWDTLESSLDHIDLVVTFNSNAGVLSTLAGRRTVTFDQGSMAWPVTSHRVGGMIWECGENIRRDWAHALAWKQWQEEELRDGTCWEHVKAGMVS